MKPIPSPLPPDAQNPYAIRARSLYIQACVSWMAGYVAEHGHPLRHYIALTLMEARHRYPDARNWEFEALARRIVRLQELDYDTPEESWSPLPDDPNAWAMDGQAKEHDRWGIGFGQGGY